MKFTPEVIAALAVLRDAAENDFERHRIDVLECDLTAPPTVEVIDDKHQKFNGVIYHKTTSGHFVTSQGIHRDVWHYHYGEVPDDYCIHHIDGNPANNLINNLQRLTIAEHQSTHMKTGKNLAKRKSILTCIQCGIQYVGYFSGNNRFCSEKCRKEYHSAEYTCEICGKKFHSTSKSVRFCSAKCVATFKRRSPKTCLTCGAAFTPKRHSNQKYCSFQCYLAHKGKKPRPTYHEERICVICGKKFSCYKYDKSRTCSPQCGAKLSWQSRKK